MDFPSYGLVTRSEAVLVRDRPTDSLLEATQTLSPQPMKPVEYRVILVHQGTVPPSGCWFYVWVDTADGAVAYVGATGLVPALRAHLHLTSDNPDHGRVQASVPHFQEREFDVLAFRLTDGVKAPT